MAGDPHGVPDTSLRRGGGSPTNAPTAWQTELKLLRNWRSNSIADSASEGAVRYFARDDVPYLNCAALRDSQIYFCQPSDSCRRRVAFVATLPHRKSSMKWSTKAAPIASLRKTIKSPWESRTFIGTVDRISRRGVFSSPSSAQLRGATLLGPRVLRIHGGPR
jgi:hypothetical protein